MAPPPSPGQNNPTPLAPDETLATPSSAPPSPNGANEQAAKNPQPMSAPETSASASPKQMTSPAKVQRVASKKKSGASPPAQNTEPSQEELLKQLTSDTPIESTPTEEPQAPLSSPAKVQRVPSKKTEEEPSAPETEPSNETLNAPPSDTNQSDSPTADDPTEKPLAAEAIQPTDTPEEPVKPAKKPAPKPQAAAISKTEHAVRSFHALHTLITNPLWAPLITDLEIKPSTLYAPRENFDTNFSDPVFRAGLKSASRLASTFGFEPEKMRFNQKLIEQIKAIEIDPAGKIKPHTENISSAIGEEKVKEILGIYHNKNFKHLLYSVATRMGSFVPTIESLARIYLSLRKKEPLSSGERLQIQEEILMRYRKAPYTEEMGKKARNLALNYFMDYLSSYVMKMYLDRFKDAPEGQDNIESSQRRHATIKAFCCNMIEEWAEKVALSSQAVMAMQAKFSDAADAHLEKLLSE